MNYPIVPIRLSDDLYHCIDPVTKRTEFVTFGDAGFIGGEGWYLYECPVLESCSDLGSSSSERAYSGFLEFGVSCGVTSVTINYEGLVERLNTGFDQLNIYLNGDVVHREQSTQSGGPCDTEFIKGSFTIEIDSTRPCGNIIGIEGSTLDSVANNGVYWLIDESIVIA